MNVVALPVSNLMDIPAMLRRLADDIEKGDHGEVTFALAIAENEHGPIMFGWGEAKDALYNVGLFEWAKAQMLDTIRSEREE
jgi:hypothetical protein